MLFQKWSKEKDNAVATSLMIFLIKLCRGFVMCGNKNGFVASNFPSCGLNVF